MSFLRKSLCRSSCTWRGSAHLRPRLSPAGGQALVRGAKKSSSLGSRAEWCKGLAQILGARALGAERPRSPWPLAESEMETAVGPAPAKHAPRKASRFESDPQVLSIFRLSGGHCGQCPGYHVTDAQR